MYAKDDIRRFSAEPDDLREAAANADDDPVAR